MTPELTVEYDAKGPGDTANRWTDPWKVTYSGAKADLFTRTPTFLKAVQFGVREFCKETGTRMEG